MSPDPRPPPDIDHVREALQTLAETTEDPPREPSETQSPEPGEVPESEELDVEGPNESGPGHQPAPAASGWSDPAAPAPGG